jgi:hypothetical protein
LFVYIVVVGEPQSDLQQIVGTLQSSRILSRHPNGWESQAEQEDEDGAHDENVAT